MKRKINLAIIGLGRAGRFHLNSINNLPQCNLKYVVDPNISSEDDIVKNNNFTLLPNVEPALENDELDAVIVSPPTQFHFQYITQSLQAGKHVFTEKPLGKTTDDIRTCFDSAEEKGLALFLGFQRRYDQNFIDLKKSMETIGQVRTIKISSRDNPKPSYDYLRISGNIFHDMLIHDFDMLQFLLGDRVPKSVFAYGHAYDSEIKSMNDFDTVLVTLQYPDGLMVSIDTSRNSIFGYDQRIELFAEKGMAIAENQRNNTVQVHTENGMNQSPINYSFPQRYKDSYAKEIEDFVNGIQTGTLNNVSKRQTMMGHLIANAAHEAATKNEVIDFEKMVNLAGF